LWPKNILIYEGTMRISNVISREIKENNIIIEINTIIEIL